MTSWMLLPCLFVFSAFAGEVPGHESSDLRATGALVAIQDEKMTLFCSGTLVAPRWVLTTARCVEAINGAYRGYEIDFVIADDASATWEDHARINWAREHPSYAVQRPNHDIGVVALCRDIRAVDPMPVNKDALWSRWMGEDLLYVGFGLGDDDAETESLRLTQTRTLLDFDGHKVYTDAHGAGRRVGAGDWGSAGLELLDHGRHELAVLNAFQRLPEHLTQDKGALAVGTRVDIHVGWIELYTPLLSADDLKDTGYDTASEPDADTEAAGDSAPATDPDSILTDTSAAGETHPSRDGERPCGCASSSSGAANAILAGLFLTLARRRRRGAERAAWTSPLSVLKDVLDDASC